MNTIQIQVSGEELETITVELSSEEVAALYRLRKENQQTIASLEKRIKDLEFNNKYTQDRAEKVESELAHAHTLMTALGVADKTDHEESYYRKDLPMATRVALYIANSKEK